MPALPCLYNSLAQTAVLLPSCPARPAFLLQCPAVFTCKAVLCPFPARRDSHPDVIIRVLRLFNLCEIGPIVSKMDSDSDSQAAGGLPRPGSAGALQRSEGSAPGLPHSGSASDLRALRPLSRNESGSSLHQQAAAAPAAAEQQLEEGEVAPERSQGEQRSQHLNLQPPQPHGSPGKDKWVAWREAGLGRGLCVVILQARL